jgi:hypothetical protein
MVRKTLSIGAARQGELWVSAGNFKRKAPDSICMWQRVMRT